MQTILQHSSKVSATLQFDFGERLCFLRLYQAPSPVSVLLQDPLAADCFQRSLDSRKTKFERFLMQYSPQVAFIRNYFYNYFVLQYFLMEYVH